MTTVNVDTTLIERPTVYGNATHYGVAKIVIPNVATLAAGGAGDTVVTNIAFTGPNGSTQTANNLPSDINYTIQGFSSQAQALSYSSKSTTGFTLTQTPLSSGTTLAAGTVDLTITWGNGATNGSPV